MKLNLTPVALAELFHIERHQDPVALLDGLQQAPVFLPEEAEIAQVRGFIAP